MVAALTIPTLISNYQKNQYVTQLKKNYNVIQNGFRQYMAQEGVTKLTDTKLIQSINGEGTWSGDQSVFQTELATIFKITKQYGEGEQKGKPDLIYSWLIKSKKRHSGEDLGDSSFFFLTDGSIIFYGCYKSEYMPKKTGKMTGELCGFEIDVNGVKKPNKYGRDLFSFEMDNQGTLFPYGGKDFSLWYCDSYSKCAWQQSQNLDYNCSTDHTSVGYGCAARIMDEGWKMNY